MKNDWRDAFFMKHGAWIKGSGCTIFPRTAMWKEFSHLEMYSVDEASGLQGSIGGLAQNVFGEFFLRKKWFKQGRRRGGPGRSLFWESKIFIVQEASHA